MRRLWAGALLAGLGLAACGGGDEGGPRTPGEMQAAGEGGGRVQLTGAGATFPYPIYARWFSDYEKSNGVRVNYQSIGSGGGIRQLTEGTVDFGASDAPMNEEELGKAPGTLHIPTVVGAVAVTYNLPGLAQPVKLSGPVLADIFLGKLTKWNDPRLQQLNPGVTLPNRDILVVHRTDASGTTYVFTEFLAAVSPAWQQQVGMGKSVKWPTGLGAKGNEGVTGQVRQTEGAVGYVEQVYAAQNDLPVAAVQNAAGQFVTPTLDASAAAAAGAKDKLSGSPDFRISIVNAAGAQAYPISTWTYLLVPAQMADCTKANALVQVVRWALTDGSTAARELGYAPLPDEVREAVFQKLGGITCGADRQPVTSGS